MASRIRPAERIFVLICISLVVLFRRHIICIFASDTFSSRQMGLFSQLTGLGFMPRTQTSIPIMNDSLQVSCPQLSINTSKRTEFGKQGCAAFSYPSSGGILIKEPVDLVDMQYLRLDRFMVTQRSTNVVEEDVFCERMRRIGATWWASEQEYNDVLLGARERTESESRVLVFGWPEDGKGVWVLRYEREVATPRDFGRLQLAMNMNERCRMMQDFGATFYPDLADVEELRGRS